MRPTNGEISCTLACPQATAWANENNSVRLVWMPRCSSFSAALMPSQVAAILMSTRSMWTPWAWYSSIRRSARVAVGLVSKLRRASTSVDTRPGMVARISQPKRTSSLSTTSVRSRPRHCATVSCNSGAYSLFCTALRMSEGLVVASCGRNWASWRKSPVSATTVVNCLSASSWFIKRPCGRPGRRPWADDKFASVCGRCMRFAGRQSRHRVLWCPATAPETALHCYHFYVHLACAMRSDLVLGILPRARSH